MAGQTTGSQQFNPYLSNAQQELLLAALASNSQKSTHIKSQDAPDMAVADFDTSPYLDYLDGDTSFDFDPSDFTGEHMFGNPAPSSNKSDSTEEDKPDKHDKHDKRKSPEEASPEDDVDAKRREGENKEAKKPGRKPLTSEPTTKRKAQNRAAQRAFRERKEKHLKDLETKVESLTKAQEQDKQENGLLRAQVQRLQTELTEYRKRMSSNSTGIAGNSPPSAARFVSRSNSNPQSEFQFDLPKFGALPGAQLFGNGNHMQPSREKTVSPTANPVSSKPNGAQSPQNRQLSSGHNSRSGSMNNGLTQDPLAATYANLFSGGVNTDYQMQNNNNNNNAFAQYADNGTDSNSGISRVFRFNSGSNSTTSPSTSSLSQFNNSSCNNSSCGTSPESSNSPPADAVKQGANDFNNTYLLNPVTSNTQKSATANQPSANTMPSFDWLASQNGGQFDPVLFGDYRESQDAIVGDGDFNSGFFDNAFPYDLGSPLNFADLSSPKPSQQPSASQNLLAEVERRREGSDEDGLPPQMAAAQQHTDKGSGLNLQAAEKVLNCNTIWSQLQSNQDFKEGKFDLDSLCSELRAKAKCSESGVTVPSEYVDAAFKKLSGPDEKTAVDNYHSSHAQRGIDYLFNQNSVDEAIRKLAQQ